MNQIQTGFENSTMLSDPAFLPGLLQPIDPLKDMNDSWESIHKFGDSSSSSPPQLTTRVSSVSKQQLNFANNTPFWNPSANSSSPRFNNESSSSNRINVKVITSLC